MITIKNRIKEFLYTKKITKLEFYKNINVSNGYLDKDGSVNSDVLGSIIKKYPEISLQWLLFGNENMNTDMDKTIVKTENRCDEKCNLKDYIINLQKGKINDLESKLSLI
jgi:hypothetical protein